MIIEIYLEYQDRYPIIKQGETFESYSGKYLLKEYHRRAREVLLKARENESQEIEWIVKTTLVQTQDDTI